MMKRRKNSLLTVAVTALVLLSVVGCESRTDKVDGGGVLLSITDFDGLPVQISVNGANAVGLVQVEEIIIQNVVKNPNEPTSQLQNVELESYEVVYTRQDTGTRLPPVFVRELFSVVPVGGTATIENLPVMSLEQLEAEPLSDLLFQNGGFDSETGGQTILLNLRIRFFGRTLSGDEVDTQLAGFTVEFTP